jgi:hypothetical protein
VSIPRKSGLCLAVVFGLLSAAAAQLQVGNELNLKANGNLFFGYSGTDSNDSGSSHGLAAGGAGNLSGSYYDPNFLNFTLSPYYDQSRSNSDYQSISNASGFNFGSSIFGGSPFPGSISFAQAFNSNGNFGIPGVANYTTRGDSQTFGINWGEHLQGLPSLAASFQMGSNEYSIYGANADGSSGFHGFTVRSGYELAGFGLSAFYSDTSSHSQVPQVLSLQGSESGEGSSETFGFTGTHALPLHGTWAAGFTRSDMDSNYAGYTYNGVIDSANTSIGFQPTNRLHMSASASYSDNLEGSLFQGLVPAASAGTGTTVSPIFGLADENQGSHAMDMIGDVSYSFYANLQAQAYAERRLQYFLGEDFGGNSYGGGLSFFHSLLGGMLTTAGNITDSTVDNTSTNNLGFSTNLSYSRPIGSWFVGGNVNYAQNVDTLLVTYMTSSYSYSAHMRKRFGALVWTAGASFARSGLTDTPDTKSSSQSFTTGIGYKQWITLSGSYADSTGNGLATTGGLATSPLLPVLIPSNLLILYGGRSYNVGLGSSPIRRLTIAASFSNGTSDTLSQGISSWNKTQMANALFQYQFRKMYITGGYTRLMQGFSASGLPPVVVQSYSMGVSRWFDFF